MARRMFSDEVTETDAFLDMPIGSQLLYFRLGMNADDDGFIASPKMVMRMIGATDDELKILFAKKFLLSFQNGICVIKHWRINNYIRKQLYNETKYSKERSQLFIRPNGSYTFNPEGAIPLPEGHFTTKENVKNGAVDNTSTQRRPRIGKDRIGKDRIQHTVAIAPVVVETVSKPIVEAPASFEYNPLFVEFWTVYPKKTGKGAAHNSWNKIKPKVSRETADKIIASVRAYAQTQQWKKENGQYIPNPATFLNQRRWEDEIKGGSESRDPKYNNVNVHQA